MHDVRAWSVPDSQARHPYVVFIPLLFILSGGIGNLIDRVTNNGLVTDFIVMGVGPLRTGVFNVADVAVMFGAMAIVCLSFRRRLTLLHLRLEHFFATVFDFGYRGYVGSGLIHRS